MATPTYIALATTTLGASAASITFSSIPATYRDLLCVIYSISDSADDIGLQLNGDTGNNYSQVRMLGWSGGTDAQALSGIDRIQVGYNANGAACSTIIHIMDYSASDKQTTTLSRANRLGSEVVAHAGRWANTAAVNQVLVYGEGSADFKAGSTISLYGIEA